MFDTDKDKVLAEIEPLLEDLVDAFDYAIPEASDFLNEKCKDSADGYIKSTLVRGLVKQQLISGGYELAAVANTGIEILFGSKYAIKVVRSDHGGNAPAPATISRASWYYANQPRLSVGGMDAEAFWSIKKLGLRGGEIDAAIFGSLGAKNDGLMHLLVDWQENVMTGDVQIAVSMPMGVWKPGETPRLAWRDIYGHGDEHGQGFVPTDEDIDFFIDDGNDETRVEAIVG